MAKKVIVVLFIALVSLLKGYTQNKDVARVFASQDFEDKSSSNIYLKWFAPGVYVPKGVNIYRQEQGTTDWVKINKSPIVISEKFPNELADDTEAAEFWKFFKTASKSELEAAGYIRAFSNAKAITNNTFAQSLGMMYIDKSTETGKTYIYEVKRIVKGKEISIGKTKPITAGPYTVKPAPEGIKLDRKRNKVDITWNHDEHSYYTVDVYRSNLGSNIITKVNKGLIIINKEENGKYPDVLFSDENISKDTTYVYKIFGIDHFGQKTAGSKEIICYIKDFETPPAAIIKGYDPDTLNVTIWWEQPKVPDLKGYNIYRSLSYDAGYEKINETIINISDTSYTDKVPEPNEYFYKIETIDTSMLVAESPPFMALIKDIVAPITPTNFKGKMDSGKFIFTWSPNPEKDLKGYFLYKSIEGSEDKTVLVNKEPITTNRYEMAIKNNVKTKFFFQLVAEDTSFNKSLPTEKIALQQPDIVPPAEPIIKTITPNGNKLEIEWIGNVESDFSHYNLYREIINKKDTSLVLIGEGLKKEKTNFVDKDVPKNIKISYYLVAFDETGNQSKPSQKYTIGIVEDDTGLSIKKFDVSKSKGSEKVTIKWQIEKGKEYYACVLYRSENGGKEKQLTGKLIEENSYIDKSVKSGNTYTYQLKAYDKLGNIIASNKKKASIN